MIVQTLGQACPGWQFKDPAVVNDTGTDIASSQRYNPAPPTVSHEMVCRPGSAGPTSLGEIGKFLSQFVAIPIFCIGEARPYRVDWVLGIWPKISEHA